MNLEDVPRIMGNPSQQLAVTRQEVLDFIRWNNGHAPCFAAHNAYPSTTDDVIPEPLSIKYECTPYDFDSDSIAAAQNDSIELVDRIESEGNSYRIRFSGSKGFHVYRVWKPLIVATRTDKQKSALKDIIRAVQINDIRECSLDTMDGRVVSDYRRLMRIPNTLWASEKRTVAGPNVVIGDTYCINITADELRSLSPEALRELAKSPRKQLSAPVNGKISILDYIHQEGLDISAYRSIQGSIPGTYAKLREVNHKLLEKLVPKICIRSDLYSQDPAHLSRFALAAHLSQLDYTHQEIVDFVHSISDEAGWVDRFNLGVTEYQVSNIINRGYKPPTCTRLKQEGLCIGPECPIYRNV